MSYNPYNKNRGPSLLSQGLGQAIGEAITGAKNLSDEQKKRRKLAFLLTGFIGARDARKEFNVKKTVDALIDSQKLETAKLDRAFNQKEELLTKKKLVNLSPTEAFRSEAELRFKDAHRDSIDMYTGPNVDIAARRAKEQWIQQDIANVLIPHFEKQYKLLNMDETGSLTKEEFLNPSMAYHKARILKETRPENLSVLHKPLARLRDFFGIERYDAEDSRLKSLKEAHEKRLNNVANFNKYDQNNVLAKRAALTEDDKDKIVLSNEEFRQAYNNLKLPDELFDEASNKFTNSPNQNWGTFKNIGIEFTIMENQKLLESKANDAKDMYDLVLLGKGEGGLAVAGQERIVYKKGTKEIDWAKTKELDNGISQSNYEAQLQLRIAKVMGTNTASLSIMAEIEDLVDMSYKQGDVSPADREKFTDQLFKDRIERGLFGESKREAIRNIVNSADTLYTTKLAVNDPQLLTAIQGYALNANEKAQLMGRLTKEKVDENILSIIDKQLNKVNHIRDLKEGTPEYFILLNELTRLHKANYIAFNQESAKERVNKYMSLDYVD